MRSTWASVFEVVLLITTDPLLPVAPLNAVGGSDTVVSCASDSFESPSRPQLAQSPVSPLMYEPQSAQLLSQIEQEVMTPYTARSR